ncbi:MAG: antibiotic biosynthesis monooxygenase family protein [Bacillus sp. (in: firmicutes)]
MFMYIASGTYDFMHKIMKDHPEEQIVLLQNNNQTTLIQESSGRTLFKHPSKFEVLQSVGSLVQKGVAALHHVPVTAEGRSSFEEACRKLVPDIKRQTGFLSIRILRPIKSDTYIIMTQWVDGTAFDKWKQADSYTTMDQMKAPSLAASPQKIFSGDAYVKTFIAPEPEKM